MTVEASTEQTEQTEPIEATEEVVEAPAEDPVEESETFSREYVEKLRKESAGYRDRAKRTDDLAARLHTALVQGSGRLQDPTDLPYDPAHLDDPEALTAAIDALLISKPHLASRRPQGTIHQGATTVEDAGTTFGSLLRNAVG